MNKRGIETRKRHCNEDVKKLLDFLGEKASPSARGRIMGALNIYNDFMDSQDELPEKVASLLWSGVDGVCREALEGLYLSPQDLERAIENHRAFHINALYGND